MFKRNILQSLVLLLAMGLIFGLCVPFCFAEETIASTTGDTDDSGGLSPGDLPLANGQLYKPQSSLSALDANAKEGELVYKSSDKKSYFYNGSDWVPQAGAGEGGGGCYVSYKPDCSGNDCCLPGFTNWGSAGWFGAAATTTFGAVRFPERGRCPGQCSYSVGEAFVCCW